jgi:hypothetical protein
MLGHMLRQQFGADEEKLLVAPKCRSQIFRSLVGGEEWPDSRQSRIRGPRNKGVPAFHPISAKIEHCSTPAFDPFHPNSAHTVCFEEA